MGYSQWSKQIRSVNQVFNWEMWERYRMWQMHYPLQQPKVAQLMSLWVTNRMPGTFLMINQESLKGVFYLPTQALFSTLILQPGRSVSPLDPSSTWGYDWNGSFYPQVLRILWYQNSKLNILHSMDSDTYEQWIRVLKAYDKYGFNIWGWSFICYDNCGIPCKYHVSILSIVQHQDSRLQKKYGRWLTVDCGNYGLKQWWGIIAYGSKKIIHNQLCIY